MSSPADALKVTSHVSRDLLQSSQLFKRAENVVWEYVANGLQYVDPGVQPRVAVTLHASPRRIVVADNGRGMSGADLRRFFIMHGENEDRRQGRAGRGYFGTGKSAAFAIADTLRLVTVRDGRRCTVELNRAALNEAGSGAPVPVRQLEWEVADGGPNRTVVTIADVRARIDRTEVVHTLERHLRYGFRGAEVTVNGETVEPASPPFGAETVVVATTTDHPLLAGRLLRLRVAKAPLDKADRGVALLADGVLHEVTLAGAETKEMSGYIFGELDVPALAEPFEGVPAFDMSRSGALNPANRLVVAVHAFVGRHVETLRLQLVAAERKRRADAALQRLQSQAEAIARLINEDYRAHHQRFQPARSPLAGPGGQLQREAATGEPAWFAGEGAPASTIAPAGAVGGGAGGEGGSGGGGEQAPVLEPATPEQADATARSAPAAPAASRKQGGFSVRYRENGADNPRAAYVADERAIYINLDHPQVAAAKPADGADDLFFRKLSCEVAFAEYAIAFGQESAQAGRYLEPADALTELRAKVDDLARRAAASEM